MPSIDDSSQELAVTEREEWKASFQQLLAIGRNPNSKTGGGRSFIVLMKAIRLREGLRTLK